MKLKDMTYLIDPLAKVYIIIEGKNEDKVYEGEWVKCNYMNKEIISVWAQNDKIHFRVK